MSQPAGQGGGPPGQSRVALVTGASAGTGFRTARDIAARGACVLITGRDRGRGDDAVRAIAAAAGHARTGNLAGISGQYITEHGKPGRYPGVVADPAFQDRVVAVAWNLARDAATAAGHRGRP